ncbi:hypothetical protein CEXT_751931 [Caerostris extrusa]|uniref:Uncharacterized protein n=1 Tax=Caerostris extrusa TaxID=172846 RepID=A0AAV4THY1_CAEEX|nr:hypothetical protein CEXT_751931 [Caerostris extrusa]
MRTPSNFAPFCELLSENLNDCLLKDFNLFCSVSQRAQKLIFNKSPPHPTTGLRIPSKHRSVVINPLRLKPPGLLDPRIHSPEELDFVNYTKKSRQAFRLRQGDARDRFGFDELLDPSRFSFWDATGRGVDYESMR